MKFSLFFGRETRSYVRGVKRVRESIEHRYDHHHILLYAGIVKHQIYGGKN